MFNKLKHIKDLRSQAKTMQNALAEESVTVDRKGVIITMDGNMKITNVSINDGISKGSLEGIITDNVNEAIKKIQRVMAQKMQQMGGIPGLS